MFSKTDFDKIYREVQGAIDECFQSMAKAPQDSTCIISYLAEGDYSYSLEKSKYNPYVIDNNLNALRDQDRLEFLTEYLNENYTFKEKHTSDSKSSVTMELMMYSHIWESEPFLKDLKRIACLANSGIYLWKVEVPDFTKHTFIREIRESLEGNKLKLAEVIRKGFSSSIRNAFAHSAYTFQYGDNKITFLNYKGKEWEIREQSFNEWSIRFCYSFVLSYLLYKSKRYFRTNIIETFDTDVFHINMPNKDGSNGVYRIKYEKDRDLFHFLK